MGVFGEPREQPSWRGAFAHSPSLGEMEFHMQTPDLWGELFRRIDQLMLFTPAMAAVLPLDQRERFLSDIKEPCHAVAYDLGWTRYLPCSRMEPDDLVA